MKCVTPVDSLSCSFVSCERKGASLLELTFYGVRGSTPTACEQTRRYGGNTACVALQFADEPPILLDLGTGLRFFGETQPEDGSFQGSALVSHLHWDHVQGLPFFVPILRPGASFDVYAPTQEDGRSVAEAFDSFMRAPYFPVSVAELPGEIRFHDLEEGPVKIGAALVTALAIPTWDARSGTGSSGAGPRWPTCPTTSSRPTAASTVRRRPELADGVDLLIHDAQYTRRVRQEVDVGPLHPSTPCGRQAGRGGVGGAVPPRPGPVGRCARRGGSVLRDVRRPHRRVGHSRRRGPAHPPRRGLTCGPWPISTPHASATSSATSRPASRLSLRRWTVLRTGSRSGRSRRSRSIRRWSAFPATQWLAGDGALGGVLRDILSEHQGELCWRFAKRATTSSATGWRPAATAARDRRRAVDRL